MFIRFRQVKAERYGDGERICAGKCKDRPRYCARHGAGMVVKGRTFVEGCPMKPLCPLTHPRIRLEVSILETRREGGKVKQQHVASLGSILIDYTIEDRVYFWAACDERLARLANRIGPDMDRLRQAIAARIPLPTDDDRAKLDAFNWDQLEDTGISGLLSGTKGKLRAPRRRFGSAKSDLPNSMSPSLLKSSACAHSARSTMRLKRRRN